MTAEREPSLHDVPASNELNESLQQKPDRIGAEVRTGIRRDTGDIGGNNSSSEQRTEAGDPGKGRINESIPPSLKADQGGPTPQSPDEPTASRNPQQEPDAQRRNPGSDPPKAAGSVSDSTPSPKTASEGDTARASEDSATLDAAKNKFIASIEGIAGGGVEFQKATVFSSQSDVVARLINLTSRLSQTDSGENLYHQAFLAATLLKNAPSSASTISLILDDIDFSTSRNSPIYTVMRGLAWSTFCLSLISIILFGLSSVVYSLSAKQSWYEVITGPYLTFVTSPIIVAATFGMLGSVVSILLRLSEFEKATRRSRQFLKMTGVMLPLVGAIFACVTCALFASGIINFSFATGDNSVSVIQNPYFYVVIGFLSGFSERFTRGLLGSAENVVASAARTDTQTVSTDAGTVTKTSEAKLTAVRGT